MAVTVSGLFVSNFIDVLDASQLAIDLSLTTNKVALFTNSVTPDFSASAANASYAAGVWNANEVAGTGYTAGGQAVASPTLTESPTGTMMYDIADPSWSSSTITAARCLLLYANALTPKSAICLVNFGADYSTSNGLFLVTVSASGLWTADWTP